MLDEDDLDFAILAAPTRGVWALVSLAVVVLIGLMVILNKSECSHKTCDTGKPFLVKGACVCLQKAE